MPLYEYECESCANRFERIQKFSDPLVETCPSCGGPVRKLLSSPAIQFKGSGWYITDYAKKGGSDGSRAGAAGRDGTGDGAKADTGKTEGAKNEGAKKDSASAPPPAASTKSE